MAIVGKRTPSSGTEFMSRIAVAVMALSSLLAACGGVAKPLPHSLSYRAGPEGDVQVWRLEADGITTVQMTHEEGGVGEFSVSPADGSLAFVSSNHLFLVDGDGKNRRLVADASQVDKGTQDYVFRGFVGAPAFSPDGRTLAYAFDGLHLYDLVRGQDEHVLKNLGILLGEPSVYAKEVYVPGPWSPDGRKLLIIISYFEGSTLAVMDREAAQPFTRLRSHGPVCCLFNWTEDSRSVLVANPHYTGDRPGLWSYDVETGEQTVLIMGPQAGGSNHYVGWPHELPSGDLVYFHAKLERFSPDVGIPLVMVRSRRDGSNRFQLRPEVFHVNQSLWAQDGSLALILQRGSRNGSQVVLARTDGSPLKVLIEGENIRDLAWGP